MADTLVRLCTVDDCSEDCSAKGFCNRHYQNFYRYGDPVHVRELACAGCGETFTPRGARSKYCSDSCRRGVATCEVCEASFLKRHDYTNRWCSVPCSAEGRRLEWLETRTCPSCGGDGPFYEGYTSSYCKPCQQARTKDYADRNRDAKRAADRAYYRANAEKASADRRANYLANKERDLARIKKWQQDNRERLRPIKAEVSARRRARKLNNGVEYYKRQDIFDRDGGVCGICDGVVDPALVHPDPLSFSIDHVIPISKGGADAPSNVQTSHLECNVRKHASLPEGVVF